MRYGPVLVSWKPWRPHQSHAFRHASSRRRPGKNRTSRFSNVERTKAGYVLGFSHPHDGSPQHSYEPTKSPRAAACVGCQAWSKAQGSGSCPVGVRRFKSCPTHPPDSGSNDLLDDGHKWALEANRRCPGDDPLWFPVAVFVPRPYELYKRARGSSADRRSTSCIARSYTFSRSHV